MREAIKPVCLALLSLHCTSSAFMDMYFTQLNGGLLANYQQSERKHSNSELNGSFSGTNSAEQFGAILEGNIYHPKLLAFTLSPSFGAFQNRVVDEKRPDIGPPKSILFGKGRAQASLLRQKPYNTTISYERDVRNYDREFVFTVDEKMERLDLSSGWKSRTLPIRLNYSKLKLNQLYLSQNLFQSETQFSGDLGWTPSEQSEGNIRISDSKNRTVATGNYERENSITNVLLNGRTLLDSSKNTSLYGMMNMNRVYGSDNMLNTIWSTELDCFAATKTFCSDFSYNGSVFSQNNNLSQGHTLRLDGRHSLYKSLETRGSLTGTIFNDDAIREIRTSSPIDWAYLKNVPLGKLSAGLGFEPAYRRVEQNQGRIRFATRSVNFSRENPVLLDELEIRRESIQVTGRNGLMVYEEGLDYEISGAGDGFQIFRLPGASFSDSIPIEVRFQHSGDVSGSTSTLSSSYRASYSFLQFLTFTYSGNRSWATKTGQEETYIPRRIIYNMGSARLQYQFLQLEARREIVDSDVYPYRENEYKGRLVFGSYADQQLHGGVSIRRRKSSVEGMNIRERTADVGYFYRFTRALGFELVWTYSHIRSETVDIYGEIWSGEFRYETKVLSMYIGCRSESQIDTKILDDGMMCSFSTEFRK